MQQAIEARLARATAVPARPDVERDKEARGGVGEGEQPALEGGVGVDTGAGRPPGLPKDCGRECKWER
ncbi:hypothetical protein ACFLRP_00230 [Bacteroidota bacterium]